jgi:peroxiredoxin
MLKIKFIVSYVILHSFLLAVGNAQAVVNDEVVTLKDTFSNISLVDLDGQRQNIDQYLENDKWLVVMFWASTCQVSDANIKQYVEFHETHKDDDAVVLGISVDGKAELEKAKMFIENNKVGFNNVIVDYKAISALFSDIDGEDWEGTPSFLIISPTGELMAQQVGAVPADFIAKYIKRSSVN